MASVNVRTIHIDSLNSPASVRLANALAGLGVTVTGGAVGPLAQGIGPEIAIRQYEDGMELIRALEHEVEADAVIVVPTCAGVCWQRAPLQDVTREADQAVVGSFLRVKALSNAFLKRRRGFLVLCTPQPGQHLDQEAAAARKVQDAIVSEGLYALLKCTSLELAGKGIRTIFVDLTEETAPDLAHLIAWSSGPENNYSTANRINF